MKKIILILSAVFLLISAIPALASVYIDWINDPTEVGLWPELELKSPPETIGPAKSWFGIYYYPPGVEYPDGYGPAWFSMHWWGDEGAYSEHDAIFVLRSDSGETGLIPLEVKLDVFGNIVVTEENAADTEFEGSVSSDYIIQSIEYGGYYKEFYGGASFQNELAYSQSSTAIEFFEIGAPYGIYGLLGSHVLWMGATPIDPNIKGESLVENYAYADISLKVIPEPATLSLLWLGLLGLIFRRRK
ncbi:MAG: PEP-CTERM sorting domain-containing protein [Candidatus Omnitrophota bacterium]